MDNPIVADLIEQTREQAAALGLDLDEDALQERCARTVEEADAKGISLTELAASRINDMLEGMDDS